MVIIILSLFFLPYVLHVVQCLFIKVVINLYIFYLMPFILILIFNLYFINMKPISKKIYLVWLNAGSQSFLCGLFLTRKAASNYLSSSKLSHLYTIEERFAFNF